MMIRDMMIDEDFHSTYRIERILQLGEDVELEVLLRADLIE